MHACDGEQQSSYTGPKLLCSVAKYMILKVDYIELPTRHNLHITRGVFG